MPRKIQNSLQGSRLPDYGREQVPRARGGMTMRSQAWHAPLYPKPPPTSSQERAGQYPSSAASQNSSNCHVFPLLRPSLVCSPVSLVPRSQVTECFSPSCAVCPRKGQTPEDIYCLQMKTKCQKMPHFLSFQLPYSLWIPRLGLHAQHEITLIHAAPKYTLRSSV